MSNHFPVMNIKNSLKYAMTASQAIYYVKVLGFLNEIILLKKLWIIAEMIQNKLVNIIVICVKSPTS